MKWLKEPLLHFLLIGAVFFFMYDMKNGPTVNTKSIVISKAEIEHLKRLWTKTRQRVPTQSELQVLIDHEIREKIMYQEALALGLDQGDSFVRRRLAQKMEFFSSDIADLAKPSEEELLQYMSAHKEMFRSPGKINFAQIYIDPSKHKLQTYSQTLLDTLGSKKNEVDITLLTELADSNMFKQSYAGESEYSLKKVFGEIFVKELFALPVQTWQGPILSSYGEHLIFIHSVTRSQQEPLNLVRDKVVMEYKAQKRKEMDKVFYGNLRKSYDVTVESDHVESQGMSQ